MRVAMLLATAIAASGCTAQGHSGVTPHPAMLRRPTVAPLSELAQLGRDLFYDPALSASGKVACASCHRADAFFASQGASAARLAGPATAGVMLRAVPSLRYVDRTPNFSIGPDEGGENIDLARLAADAARIARTAKAGDTVHAIAMVPQGGLFWDGRANTLEDQAMGPLFNAEEMANRDVAAVAAVLRSRGYAARFAALVGAEHVRAPQQLVDEAMFALARYQVEDSSFHPYTSKYDFYLEGKASLTRSEARGLRAFDDRSRGNCSACHLDRPAPDGTPPAFTDYQYEALGVPRNDSIAFNRDPHFFDLGVCGPTRADMRQQLQYCGMFRTPSLRNVATRKVLFHNGRYRSLEEVLAFYNLRAVRPDLIYPAGSDGTDRRFDDIPAQYRANIDTIDSPFNRHPGQAPAMSELEIRDIIAFLRTLTDGYVPAPRRQ